MLLNEHHDQGPTMQESHATTTQHEPRIRTRGPRRIRPELGNSTPTKVVAIVIAALLSLAACTSPQDGVNVPGAPTPDTAPTTAAATIERTPEPSTAAVYQPATAEGPAQNVPVPVLPEQAKEFSKEGLIAFAEYWYATLGYAYETGDPGPMLTVSDPACPSCSRVKDNVTDLYRDGGWLMGGQMIVHQSTSTFIEVPDGTYQAVLMIQQNKVTSYDGDGTLQSDSRAMPSRADIVVAAYSNGQWSARKAEHLTKD